MAEVALEFLKYIETDVLQIFLCCFEGLGGQNFGKAFVRWQQ